MDNHRIESIENEINDKDSNLYLLSNILQSNSIPKVIADQNRLNTISDTFNVDLKSFSVSDQFNSGRCWIFASTNMLRYKMIRKYKLSSSFELSQAYIAKYDKIEKCLLTLENLYKLSKKNVDIDDLQVHATIARTLTDGGNWNDFQRLILKYGIVPKDVFQDTYQNKNTRDMNDIVTSIINKAKIKIFCTKCKNKKNFNKLRNDTMDECIRVISMCLGVSPKIFTWRNSNQNRDHEYTPLTFYKKMVYPVQNIVNLINLPQHTLGIKLKTDGLMYDEYNTCYNSHIPMLKNAIYKCLTKEHMPAFFSIKMDGKYSFKNYKILDTEASLIENMFQIDLSETKKQGMLSSNHIPNHAMVIVGCDYDAKTKTFSKWKVQNSWGSDSEDSDNNGIVMMTDKFFDEYISDVCVPKSCLPIGYLNKFTKEKYIKHIPLLD